jgi:hypothetical protein
MVDLDATVHGPCDGGYLASPNGLHPLLSGKNNDFNVGQAWQNRSGVQDIAKGLGLRIVGAVKALLCWLVVPKREKLKSRRPANPGL